MVPLLRFGCSVCFRRKRVSDEVLMARRQAEDIPWGDNGVDIVVESTGVFTTKEKVHPDRKNMSHQTLVSITSNRCLEFRYQPHSLSIRMQMHARHKPAAHGCRARHQDSTCTADLLHLLRRTRCSGCLQNTPTHTPFARCGIKETLRSPCQQRPCVHAVSCPARAGVRAPEAG